VSSGEALPPGLHVDAVSLARGDDVWTGAATEESPRINGATTVEFVTRNGPDWAPGDSVDLAARIISAAGAAVTLRAPRFVIARVY
jgi:hypothetical protein